MKIFEQSLSESSTAVAPVSLSDWQKFKSDLPGITGRVVPIGYEFVKPLTFTHNKPWRLLFLGRLDWPPNREGLIWFITKVWSKLKDSSQFELIVAGSGENEWLKRLLVSQKGHPIRFLGVIENLAKCYEDCHLSLIPIFSGSGTRVKVIEASRYGRACLSTGLGVEGCGLSPGQSYLGAETADEWLLQLEQFDSNKIEQIGRNAFDQLKGVFDQNQSSQIFSELIA